MDPLIEFTQEFQVDLTLIPLITGLCCCLIPGALGVVFALVISNAKGISDKVIAIGLALIAGLLIGFAFLFFYFSYLDIQRPKPVDFQALIEEYREQNQP